MGVGVGVDVGVVVGLGVGVLPLMCGQPSYESTPESTHACGRCGDWAAAEVMRWGGGESVR